MLNETDRSNLITRFILACIAMPVVLGSVYFGGIYFILFLIAGFAISYGEWFYLVKNLPNNKILQLIGLLYCGLATYYIYLMRLESVALLVTFFFLIWASDTGAYVFGKTFGKHKIAPSISPNKTWEGLLGACIAPFLITFIVTLFFYSEFDNAKFLSDIQTPYIYLPIIAGLVFGLSGQMGDFMISKLKRMAGVKDTGKLLPGHGGLLDRIDSLIFTAIIFGTSYLFILQ